MSIDEQPMNVYWSGKRTETSNNFKTNYKGSVATKNNLPSSGNKKGDMYNVAESDENFIWNGSSWDSLSGDILKTLNWQKSEKAGAVAVYPVSETMLYPVVEFAFTETDPAEGDKSSDNPSILTGVSSVKVTRYGKNLLRYPYADGSSKEGDGLTWTVASDGSINVIGTSIAGSSFALQSTSAILTDGILVAPGVYRFSGCPSGGVWGSTWALRAVIASQDADVASNSTDFGSGATLTVTTRPVHVSFFCTVWGGNSNINITFKPQLELASTVTTFEPYDSTNYVIDLGDTYYGGTIDVASGVMTVTHAAVTPEESTVDISSAPAALPLDYADTYGRTITSADGTSLSVGSTGGTVVYKLAVPQTVQLSPVQILSFAQADKYTPKLNTIYTNASSVQVGYAKSPIRSEYELAQAIAAIEGSE